jgi:hypothetical protein
MCLIYAWSRRPARVGQFNATGFELWTSSVEHSPSSEANSSSPSQAVPFTLWKPEIHYCVHNSPPLVSAWARWIHSTSWHLVAFTVTFYNTTGHVTPHDCRNVHALLHVTFYPRLATLRHIRCAAIYMRYCMASRPWYLYSCRKANINFVWRSAAIKLCCAHLFLWPQLVSQSERTPSQLQRLKRLQNDSLMACTLNAGSHGNHSKPTHTGNVADVMQRHTLEQGSSTLGPLVACGPPIVFMRPRDKFWILSVKSLIQINKC